MSTSSMSELVANGYQSGCFSRPEESQETYVHICSTWGQSDNEEECQYPQIVRKAFAERFAIDLQKIPVEISSKGLMPWELACCWVDQDGRGTIQIRPNDRPFKFVQSEAILTHEAVHAVRGRLFSSIFEEHCAYAACYEAFPHSFPFWRTFLGPLFTSPKEVVTLLLLIWGTWCIPMIFDWDVSYPLLFCLSLTFLLFPCIRLLSRWKIWQKAMKNVSSEWPNKEWKLMIRLSDEEVKWLAQLPKEEVRDAVHEKAAREWRWGYFLDDLLD
jgi:hypothetical protein